MAGVPDLSWRRSLDRCTAYPSEAYVPVGLDMFYRDRYSIPMLEDLLKDGTRTQNQYNCS